MQIINNKIILMIMINYLYHNFLTFFGDTMKIWKLFVLCIVVSMMAVSVVSAKEETTSPADRMIVKPVNFNYIEDIGSMLTLSRGDFYVSQGETDTTTLCIGESTNSLTVHCTWNNPDNSLLLTIISPSGTSHGPFSDTYNGAKDGDIGVTISKSSGTWPADGVWTFNVYGQSVSGTQRYYISGTWA